MEHETWVAARKEWLESEGDAGTTLRQSILRVLGVYAITRFLLLLSAFLGTSQKGFSSVSVLLSGWYGQDNLAVVASGYPAHPDVHQFSIIAFLPGFPMLVRLVTKVTPFSALGAGVVVSLLAGAGLVVVATRLVAEVWDVPAGERAGILLCVFPGSFVLSLPYSDGLALLLATSALLAVWLFRPILGGLLSALATCTSPLMLVLTPVLLWRAWRSRELRVWVAACLSPLGFLAFVAFIGHRTGNYGAWFQEERYGFDRSFSVMAPFDFLRSWPGIGLIELLSLAAMALGFYALWQARAPKSWIVISALIMFLVIFDASSWATPRFVLDAFPLVLGLGVWSRRSTFTALVVTFAVLLPLTFLAYMTLGNVTGQP